jgi:hypothetical protein
MGLLLEVSLDGESRVVYEAAEEEIRALALSESGEMYLGTVATWQDEHESNGAYGRVIRVEPSGAATGLWTLEGAGIYSLALADDGIIAGTGRDGELHLIDWEGSSTLLARSDAQQILSLESSDRGVLVGTGSPGSVMALGPSLEKDGVYLSEVHEAPNVAKWGKIAWNGALEDGELELTTRTGNTSQPGEDWSEWSPAYSEESGSQITSPPARFIQWQAKLTRDGASKGPELGEVRVSYLEANLRPTVTDVTVYPQGKGYFEGSFDSPPRTVSQNLPDGISVQYSLPESYSRTIPDEQIMLVRGLRTMRWEADDPNGDRLQFDLFYRGMDESTWKPLDEKLENPIYTWNTDGFADGTYVVKVVACDARDNAAGGLSHSKTSDSFVIDNMSPEIRDVRLSGSKDLVRATGVAEDILSPIVSVSFSVDGSEWLSTSPKDGVFDSKMEEFSLETAPGPAGQATISVRATDRSGNTRVISTIAGD